GRQEGKKAQRRGFLEDVLLFDLHSFFLPVESLPLVLGRLGRRPRTISIATRRCPMKRRLNQRAHTSLRVRTEQGSLVSFYRGVEVSPTGIVVDLGRPVGARDQRIYVKMEIVLPERMRPLRALARPVW